MELLFPFCDEYKRSEISTNRGKHLKRQYYKISDKANTFSNIFCEFKHQ